MLVWAVPVPEAAVPAPDHGRRHQSVGGAGLRTTLPGPPVLAPTQRSRDHRAGVPESRHHLHWVVRSGLTALLAVLMRDPDCPPQLVLAQWTRPTAPAHPAIRAAALTRSEGGEWWYARLGLRPASRDEPGSRLWRPLPFWSSLRLTTRITDQPRCGVCDRQARLGLLEQASSCRGTDAPRCEAPVKDRSQYRSAHASTPPGGEGDGEAPFHLGSWWVVPERALGSNIGASRQGGEPGSHTCPLLASPSD